MVEIMRNGMSKLSMTAIVDVSGSASLSDSCPLWYRHSNFCERGVEDVEVGAEVDEATERGCVRRELNALSRRAHSCGGRD